MRANRRIANLIVPGVLLLYAGVLPVALPAQDVAEPGWTFSQGVAALRRPLGVSLNSRIRYTLPLYRDRSGLLWDSAKIELGFNNQLSPAFDDLAVEIMIEPVAIFDVTARAGVRYAYDGLGFGFAALESYDADYEDRGALPYRSALGLFAAMTPRLKAQVGPIIVANALSVMYFDFSGTGDSHFYEQAADIALATRDHILQNTMLLLYDLPVRDRRVVDNSHVGAPRVVSDSPVVRASRVVRAGVTYLFLRVPGSGEQTQRIAVVGLWEEPIGRSPWRLSAALVLGPYLEHRYYEAAPADLFAAGQISVARRL